MLNSIKPVPNLFGVRRRNEALCLYSKSLGELRKEGDDPRVVQSCRQIRTHANRAGHPDWAYFTYSFEIDSLCNLGDFRAAWRQLRRWERVATGRALDVGAHKWTDSELNWFFHYHPNILYFLRQHRPASRMLESLLTKLVARRRKGISYAIFSYVYWATDRPKLPHQVSLYHLYRELGKSLLEWPHWKRFVAGFHPKVLELAGITKAELQREPSLLRRLSEAITKERGRRLTAGVSFGESDLVDAPSKVRRRQDAVARKIAKLALKRNYSKPIRPD